MRSAQVMRRGRRITVTNKEMLQSMSSSCDIPSPPPPPPPSSSKGRCSTSLFTNKQHQDSQASNENDKSSVQKRNAVLPRFNPSSQRASFQQKDFEELEKSRRNIQNFYIFFLTLFIVLFLCIVYSFIRMMTKSV
ncbi:unnamed protein product [Rotaria socialis]|uniref:Uncharacterized protein n=1 Tax=Rotaria socialis TaxID=392032 RepID=A0A818UMD7_9BILA|nr:unnamed protein product [Rotaria socialis]